VRAQTTNVARMIAEPLPRTTRRKRQEGTIPPPPGQQQIQSDLRQIRVAIRPRLNSLNEPITQQHEEIPKAIRLENRGGDTSTRHRGNASQQNQGQQHRCSPNASEVSGYRTARLTAEHLPR